MTTNFPGTVSTAVSKYLPGFLLYLGLGASLAVLAVFALILLTLLIPLFIFNFQQPDDLLVALLSVLQFVLPGPFVIAGAIILTRCILAAPTRRSIGALTFTFSCIAGSLTLFALGQTLTIQTPSQVADLFVIRLVMVSFPLWIVIPLGLMLLAGSYISVLLQSSFWHIGITGAITCFLVPLACGLSAIIEQSVALGVMQGFFYGLPASIAGFILLVTSTAIRKKILAAPLPGLCPGCDYDTAGNSFATTCPECGISLVSLPKQPTPSNAGAPPPF